MNNSVISFDKLSQKVKIWIGGGKENICDFGMNGEILARDIIFFKIEDKKETWKVQDKDERGRLGQEEQKECIGSYCKSITTGLSDFHDYSNKKNPGWKYFVTSHGKRAGGWHRWQCQEHKER